jgi:hypothetical protein
MAYKLDHGWDCGTSTHATLSEAIRAYNDLSWYARSAPAEGRPVIYGPDGEPERVPMSTHRGALIAEDLSGEG